MFRCRCSWQEEIPFDLERSREVTETQDGAGPGLFITRLQLRMLNQLPLECADNPQKSLRQSCIDPPLTFIAATVLTWHSTIS